ncbi:hypothetical protein HHI36_017648 [Cryptolaemus montrouzieri]|uniref:Zinc finger PHD-type domain-containing protein n=1 Tax=Cryptolaemus montrouzieri TaxID=559131 RepID=A0ABD2NNJ2_9CUCU
MVPPVNYKKCHLVIRANSYCISCKGCMVWIHRDCAKLTAEEINGFAKEFKIPDGKRFLCTDCSLDGPRRSDRDKSLSDPKLEEELFERIKHYFDAKLDSEMEMIRVENDKLFAKFENRVKTLEAEVGSLKEQIRSLEENGSDKLLKEIHERSLRSSNIMIYKVAE